MEEEFQKTIFTVEVETDPQTGRIETEEWYHQQSGRRGRAGDLPAIVAYFSDTGLIAEQHWFSPESGRHRDGDLPALVMRDEDGSVHLEQYWMFGKMHRSGGKPASIEKDRLGRIIYKGYCEFGQLHRVDGPAVEEFDPATGKLTRAVYFVRGEEDHDRNSEPRHGLEQ